MLKYNAKFFLPIICLFWVVGSSSLLAKETPKLPRLSTKPPREDVLCYGQKTAKTALIYLHGIDGKTPSKQELDNRKMLKKIAEAEGIRVAIIRSPSKCPTNKSNLCWEYRPKERTKASYDFIKEAASSCFDLRSNIILLGFSNGGYLASRLAQHCLAPEVSHVISVGSAGVTTEGIAPQKGCSDLFLVIGKKDMTNSKTKRYSKLLKKGGVKVKVFEFKGGHELPEALLGKIVRDLKK